MLGDDAGTPSVIGALVDNHGGDLGLALDLVDIAADAGCSAVSLRRCATEDAYTDEVLRRANRGWPEAGPTVRNLLESFRLPANALPEVRDRCRGSLDLVAAPYDLASLEEVAALEPEAYQVEPPVLGHVPLLRELAATGRPVLVVCGACTSEEIARALSVLGEDHTMLLHTVAADEVTLAETALGYLSVLRERFGRPVGYYGVEPGIVTAVAAFAMGAGVVEKPFTSDHRLPGPGHRKSLDRDELRELAGTLRDLARAIAMSGERMLLPVELREPPPRATLVARRDLRAGEVLRAEELRVSIGTAGVSPLLLDQIVDRSLAYEVTAGSPITLGILEP